MSNQDTEQTSQTMSDDQISRTSPDQVLDLVHRAQTIKNPENQGFLARLLHKRRQHSAASELAKTASSDYESSGKGYMSPDTIRNAMQGSPTAIENVNELRGRLKSYDSTPDLQRALNKVDQARFNPVEMNNHQLQAELHNALGANPRLIKRAIFDNKPAAVESVIDRLRKAQIDETVRKRLISEVYKRRDWTQLTIVDHSIVDYYVDLISENDPDLGPLINPKEVEILNNLASRMLGGNQPRAKGKQDPGTFFYRRLVQITDHHYQNFQKVKITHNNHDYEIADFMVNSHAAAMFQDRFEKTKQQVDDQKMIDRIDKMIKRLPWSVRKTIGARKLVHDLHPKSNTNPIELQQHLDKLNQLTAENTGVNDIDKKTKNLKRLTQHRLEKETAKVEKSIENLSNLIETFDFELHTPADFINELEGSGDQELIELAGFLNDEKNEDFMVLIARLIKREKAETDPNLNLDTERPINPHQEWKDLLEDQRSPEELIESVIDPEEMTKIRQVVEEKLKSMGEGVQDLIENGKVNFAKVGKLAMEAIMESMPSLKKYGKWALIATAIVVVVSVAVPLIAVSAAGNQR